MPRRFYPDTGSACLRAQGAHTLGVWTGESSPVLLRSRRERLTPQEVGLPAGTRRRTPGLRREEVSQLALVSVSYYMRLEQASAPRPSLEVLTGIGRALRLDDVERDHLHHLAGAPRVQRVGAPLQVRHSILDLLDRLPNAGPSVSADYEVLAWNSSRYRAQEDFSARSRRDRNVVRRVFLGPHAQGNALTVSPTLTSLPAVRRRGSEEFAHLWAEHDVTIRPALVKTFDNRLAGPVTVNCDALAIADQGQQLVIYTAAPGLAAEETLRLLSVVGTQHLPDTQ